MDRARGLLEDADDYVSSVMGSQRSTLVLRTPLPSNRKRFLSAPDGTESEIKKSKNDNNDNDVRPVIKAKRNLLNIDNQIMSQGTNNDKKDDESVKSNQNIKVGNKQQKAKKSKTKADQSIDEGPEEIMTRAEVHRDADIDIKDILKKMSDNMHSMQDIMNQRMDVLEKKD